jgi:hypothetical protein
MKNMKNIILEVIGVLVGLSSCTANYDNYNTNPADASKDEMQRDGYLLSSAVNTMEAWVIPLDVNSTQMSECLLGGSYGGYFADSNAGFSGKNFAQYCPAEGWLNWAFNNYIPKYFIGYNEVKSNTSDPIIISVARVIKVAGMQRIADIYGPVPYSKVGADGKITAPYDSQKDAYLNMIADLDTAITMLTENATKNFNAKIDKVYSGNVVKWVKLANSLKLRMAMRMVRVEPALAKQYAEEVAAHSIGAMSSNDDNALMPVSAKNGFRVVCYEYNGGDSRISADITSYMNGYNDPRREKMFTKSAFSEVENGYIGLRSGIIIGSASDIYNYSNMVVQATDALLWMNAAEVAFLKAEGALRGWNMGGTAKDFYNKGIELSFGQWGAAGAAAYESDKTSTPAAYSDPVNTSLSGAINSNITIAYDESANFDANLERIITQKWIANFPLGIEAWSEYRRTGYPALMPSLVNNSGGTVDDKKMARRVTYPQSERNSNTENYNYAVTTYLNGPDTQGTDVWWAK